MIAAILYAVALAAVLIYLAYRWWRLRQSLESLGFAAFLLVFAYNSALAISVILLGEWPGVRVARLLGALGAAVVAVGLLVVGLRVQRNGRRRGSS